VATGSRRLLTTGVAVVCLAVIAAPSIWAAPNPWKALGQLRQAWKESDEARFAFTIIKDTTKTAVADWHASEGLQCAWRTAWPTYCWNGYVTARGRIELWILGVKMGNIPRGRTMSGACITRRGYVRVLWPLQGVPSYWVRASNLTGGTLPLC
jgi:hypothetical protein